MRLPGIAGLVVLALVISCTGVDKSLRDISWTLVALGPVSAPQTVLEGSAATLLFSKGGREISGYTGCNSYWGSYKGGRSSFTGDSFEGSFTVHRLSWTEAGCPSPGLFEQERAMKDILIGAQRYSSIKLQLTIESADGRVLVFEK